MSVAVTPIFISVLFTVIVPFCIVPLIIEITPFGGIISISIISIVLVTSSTVVATAFSVLFS